VGKETWKLFFTKTGTNLDDALLKFSNMVRSLCFNITLLNKFLGPGSVYNVLDLE